jgi:microcin C transport system substrate-binding protein
MRFFVFFLLSFFVSCGDTSRAESSAQSHALALHGQPKYGADFQHFDYVNPHAPVGGTLKMAAYGTFDTLNPFLLKGVAASELMGNVFETLMVPSFDEPFSRYGLIAKTVEVSGNTVTFTMNPKARFADNSPITAQDVVFSFGMLKQYGQPAYRSYYREVENAAAPSKDRVVFTLKEGHSRELPLILGDLPVISKAYYTAHDFNKTTLVPPLSSGPYRIETVKPGRLLTLKRRADYWGWSLPVNRGMYNFETLSIPYYRDSVVALQAFKGGDHDVRLENISKLWATAYDFPAVQRGDVVVRPVEDGRPAPVQGFVMNHRRPLFQDRRVREALSLAFDFEWINKTLFFGTYRRTFSYFGHTDLSATGLPSPEEVALLAPFRDQLPPEVFTKPFALPVLGTPQARRASLEKADALLTQAGWVIKDGVRVRQTDGTPFRFEMLMDDTTFERVAAPFAQNLKKLGIVMTVRIVDSAQYQKRLEAFDYDMTPFVYPVSLSPGNEQYAYWGSRFANVQGAQNIMGIQDPVVDALTQGLLKATTRQDLQTYTRALDRVLLWQHHLIHHWRLGQYRLAHRAWLKHPETLPPYSLGLPALWWDGGVAARLESPR